MFAYSFKIAAFGFLLLGTAGAIDFSSQSADSSIDRHLHQGDNDLPTQATRRQTLQARITILNADIDNLTPDEIIFFEDCWKEVYNTKSANNDDDTTVRSVVVEGQNDSNNNRRQLNGGESRSLFGRNKRFRGYIFNRPTALHFDIWTVIEISCYLCRDDRRLKGGVRGKGNDKKNTGRDGLHRQFEGAFCDKLREGPYEVFSDVEGCRVVYMAA
jgi:hypothetical protein